VSVTEYQTVPPTSANVHLTRVQRHAQRLGNPPPLEELGCCPRLEHDPRRSVERPRDDDLTFRGPFHGRAILPRHTFTFFMSYHCACPSFSIPRPRRPTRRTVRPKAGDIARSTPLLLRGGARQACRSARAPLSGS